MKTQKCDNYTSDMFTISAKKLFVIASTAIPIIISSTWFISSIAHEQKDYYSDTDSLKVSVKRIESKLDVIYYKINPTGDFQTALKNYQNTLIVAKIEDIELKKTKRICYTDKTAFDSDNFESKILK